MTAVEAMRAYCLSLPDTSEGAHFGAVAFRVGKKMFTTVGDQNGVVVQLEPEHAAALVEKDARFKRYPQARHTVSFELAAVREWKELVRESYELQKAAPKKKPSGKASRSKK
jgi:predicted DNA-binding protein (MmcQ/YjbR family)